MANPTSGNDTLIGTTGDDFIIGMGGDDSIRGGAGNDSLAGDYENAVDGFGNDTIYGEGGNDFIAGWGGNDYIDGGSGENWLDGKAGNDTIIGGDGGNFIDGGPGDDLLMGGSGPTIYVVDSAGDVISGETTYPSDPYRINAVQVDGGISYTLAAGQHIQYLSAGRFDLAKYASGVSAADSWDFSRTENTSITGNELGQIIEGNAGDNILHGGGGNDTIYGGAGSDTANYSRLTSDLSIALGGASGKDLVTTISYQADGKQNFETLREIENIIGGSGDDAITGDNQSNFLSGGLGNDTLDGGGGTDTADYSYVSPSTGLSVTLDDNNTGDVSVGSSELDTLRYIENVFGGSGSDTITGNSQSNLFRGGGGFDTIDGGGGLDTIDYSYIANGAGGINFTLPESLTTTTVVVNGFDRDSITNIENVIGTPNLDTITGNSTGNYLRGGAGVDILTGLAGDDILDGGEGIDNLIGGAGSDIYIVDSVSDDVVEATGEGFDIVLVKGGITYAIAEGKFIEILAAGEFDYERFKTGSSDPYTSDPFTSDTTENTNLTGNSLGQQLRGNAGDNILIGAGGNDALSGGAGSDTADYGFLNQNQNLQVSLGGASGNDSLTSVNYTISNVAYTDTLFEIENIFGSSFDDYIRGDWQSNILRGRGGNDTLDGAGGSDTADYSYASTNLSILLSGTGTDSVSVAFNDTDTLQSIENIRGGSGSDSITGDWKDNVLSGREGNDILDGRDGLDTADYSYASTNLSILLTGTGTDSVYVGPSDNDTLYSIENIIGGSGNDSISGDKSDNQLVGGGGNDFISGGGGADYLGGGLGNDYILGAAGGNILDGGAGTDTLEGGTGGDLYIVDSALDVVVDTSPEVHSSIFDQDAIQVNGDISYTLAEGNYIEFLTAGRWDYGRFSEGRDPWTYSNAENANITGNAFNQTIVGNTGDNILHGGGGNDTIYGGAGSDAADYSRLTSGLSVALGGASGNDLVTTVSYQANGKQNFETLREIENIIGGLGNDTISGDRFSNEIYGGRGSDNLNGRAGDDRFVIDTNNGFGDRDTIEGGAGARDLLIIKGYQFDQIVLDDLGGGQFEIIAKDLSYSALITGGIEFIEFRDAGPAGSDASNVEKGDVVSLSEALYAVTNRANINDTLRLDQLDQQDDGRTFINVGRGNDAVFGTGGNNTIFGGAGDDTLMGADGDDLLFGGVGSDVLTGGGTNSLREYRGRDTLLGGEGNDRLTVFAGENRLDGGAGSDVLVGGLGVDLLIGGIGADTIDGSGDVDTVDYSYITSPTTGISVTLTGSTNATVSVGGAAEDTLRNIENIIGGSGNDTITGDDSHNFLLGAAGNDSLSGGAGNDQLAGGDGSDRIDGGAGDDRLSAGAVPVGSNPVGMFEDPAGAGFRDTLIGGSGNDMLLGLGGDDFLDGGDNNDSMVAGAGNDTLIGGAGIDFVDGGSGNDNLDGGADNDFIAAGAGNDTLTGGTGIDIVDGGSGNDLLIAGAGNDTMNGGDGVDTADYSYLAAANGINLTLDGTNAVSVSVSGLLDDRDSLRNVENVFGGAGDDTITGDAADNILRGGLGKDALDGGSGVDTADYSYITSSASGVSVTLTGSMSANVSVGGVAEDSLKNIENITGGAGNDTLTGDARDNILFGGAGNDTLSGGLGNDKLAGGDGNDLFVGNDDFVVGAGAVALDGGAGIDTADYSAISNSVSGISVMLGGAAVADLSIGGSSKGTLVNIENVIGGGGNDNLRGDALANMLSGGLGSDTFAGGLGNDTIDGGGDVDTVDYSYITSPATAINVALNGSTNATVSVGGAAEDTLRNIENIIGGSGNDTISSLDSSENFFFGAAGNDSLSGGGGNDQIAGGDGNDRIDGGAGDDKLVSGAQPVSGYPGNGMAEDMSGAAFLDTLIGGAGNDTLLGLGGNDSLDGGEHDDVISAGAGNDTLIGGTGNDVLEGGSGNDDLDGGAGNDYLIAATSNDSATGGYGFGGDTLKGASGDDVLIGSAGNDVLDGGEGNDQLEGGSGADIVNGGAGDDLLFGATSASQTANDAGPMLVDTLLGGDGHDNLYGSSGADLLSGGGGNDFISGENSFAGSVSPPGSPSSNDTLIGGTGNDTLIGGSGASDFADYSYLTTATTGISVTLNGSMDATVRVGASAEDTLRNIENIIGGMGNDTIAGDLNANVLLGGGGNDSLSGDSGNDLLDGGLGNDSATGGAGSNTLVGGAGNDTLDGGFGGQDTADYTYLSSDLSISLTAGNATVSASTSDIDRLIEIENITAGKGNDTIAGDERSNVLIGGEGNDLLAGRAGVDTLDGGFGNDTADYAYIADGTAGINVTLSETGSGTVSINGVIEDSLISIENVFGGAGSDQITGNSSANVLRGGAGSDTLDGGSGSDTADYAYLTAASSGINVTLDSAGSASVDGGAGDQDRLLNIENVSGGDGNDTIVGNADANILSGGRGNDILDGSGGSDTADYSYVGSTGLTILLGGTGNDTVSVSANSDVDRLLNIENIIGGSGNDTITGDNRDNSLSGAAGNDSLSGGAGNDQLSGGDGSDNLVAGAGDDILVSGNARPYSPVSGVLVSYDSTAGAAFLDILDGGDGNDTLIGLAGRDSLIGGAGNDSISGGLGNDTLIGGADNDILAGGEGSDSLDGGAGDDMLYVAETWTMPEDGGASMPSMDNGSKFLDTLSGGDGNDTLFGASGKDRLSGGAGNDLIRGGSDNDTLLGDVGNDTLEGGSGSDSLVGGDGDDLFKGATNSWMAPQTAIAQSIDTLDGLAGLDTADYSSSDSYLAYPSPVVMPSGASGISVTLNGGTVASVSIGGVLVDRISNIENIIGGAGNDTITGDGFANVFMGGGGNDVLDGGGGNDTADYSYTWNGVSVELGGALGNDSVGSATADSMYGPSMSGVFGSDIDILRNIENISGGFGNDQIFGNAGANTLLGGAGNDTLNGGAGNDLIDGGAGNDLLLGDFGSVNTALRDNYFYGGADTLDGGSSGVDTALFQYQQNVYSIEAVGQDLVLTNVLNPTYKITVKNTVDELIFARIDDEIGVSYDSDPISFQELFRTATTLGERFTTNGADIAGVGVFDITDDAPNQFALDGGGGNDTLYGSASDDVLIGGLGNDLLVGGAGKDVYAIDSLGDAIVELEIDNIDLENESGLQEIFSFGGMGDVAIVSVTGYTIGTGVAVEDFIADGEFNRDEFAGWKAADDKRIDITGNELGQALIGNAAANLFAGMGGDDHLFGGAGNDTIDGGLGNDLLMGGVGNDSLTGGAGDDGFAFDWGQLSGWNFLGRPSNYAFTGGVDTIDGGAGDDFLLVRGSINFYKFVRTSATDITVTSLSGESAVLRGVEYVYDNFTPGPTDATEPVRYVIEELLSSSGLNDNLTASEIDVYTNTGSFIDADAGDDTILGTNEADTLIGGAGNDRIEGRSLGDYGHGEMIVNPSSDVLDGGAGNDLIIGGVGKDTLIGGTGNDTMIGGAGKDRFIIDSTGDVAIEVFETSEAQSGSDDVAIISANWQAAQGSAIENLVADGAIANGFLKRLTPVVDMDVNITGNNFDENVIGNGARNSLVGGGGNDRLFGSGGADTLEGGTGVDVLMGGSGNDILRGGADQDFFFFNLEQKLLDGDAGFVIDDALDRATGGNDVVDGGQGNDVLVLDGSLDDYTIERIGNAQIRISARAPLPGQLATEQVTIESVEALLFTDDVQAEAPEGGPDADFLLSQSSNYTQISDIIGASGNDDFLTLNQYAPGYTIGVNRDGLAGNDILSGGEGNDTLIGGTGNDSLIANVGNDILSGGEGNDTLISGTGNDSLSGGAGNDLLFSDNPSGYSDTLSGDDGNDTLIGSFGNDLLAGGAGSDSLVANGGNDTLLGDDGSDFLIGGAGNDVLTGGAGNDVLVSNGGEDVINAGDGDDLIEFGNRADLSTDGNGQVALYGGLGNDTYVFYGRPKASVMDDAGGVDTAIIHYAPDPDDVSGTDASIFDDFNFYVDAKTRTFMGPDRDGLTIREGTFDFIEFNKYDGSGDFALGVSPIESVRYRIAPSSLVSNAWTFADTVSSGTAVNDLIFSTWDSSADGNWVAVANNYNGGRGDDQIQISAHVDSIVQGGEGFNLISVAASESNQFMRSSAMDPVGTLSYAWTTASVEVDMARGLGVAFNANGDDVLGIDEFSGLANVIGGGGSDLIEGDYFHNRLGGAAGRDSLVGGFGNDTLDGGEGDDSLNGGEDDDILIGGVGNDSLMASSGSDVLAGGAGDDVYFVDMAAFGSVVVTELANAASTANAFYGSIGTGANAGGTDRMVISGLAGVSQLADLGVAIGSKTVLLETDATTALIDRQNVERVQFEFGASRTQVYSTNWGSAGTAADDLVFAGRGGYAIGGNGNDAVIGTTSRDVLIGGSGNDILSGGFDEDKLIGGVGDDTLSGGWSDDLLMAGAGNDQLLGGDGNDMLSGGDGHDWLWGEEGDDNLIAGIGNDTLLGALGNDILNGGEGNDGLSGGSDSDTLVGDLGNDTLDGGAEDDNLDGGDGHDNLFGGIGTDYLVGGAGNDLLDGGLAGDTIYGGAGNDTLIGGSGDDHLFGGEGNDVLYLDWSTTESVQGGDGSDTFVFSFTPNPYGPASIADFKLNEDFLKFDGINPLQYTDVYVNGVLMRGVDTRMIPDPHNPNILSQVDDGPQDDLRFTITEIYGGGSLSVSLGSASPYSINSAEFVGIDTVTEYRALLDRIILG
jgi:Ca2+-binding RTX toxin-like protein